VTTVSQSGQQRDDLPAQRTGWLTCATFKQPLGLQKRKLCHTFLPWCTRQGADREAKFANVSSSVRTEKIVSLRKTLGWRADGTFLQPLRLRKRRFCDTFPTLGAGKGDNREPAMTNV